MIVSIVVNIILFYVMYSILFQTDKWLKRMNKNIFLVFTTLTFAAFSFNIFNIWKMHKTLKDCWIEKKISLIVGTKTNLEKVIKDCEIKNEN